MLRHHRRWELVLVTHDEALLGLEGLEWDDGLRLDALAGLVHDEVCDASAGLRVGSTSEHQQGVLWQRAVMQCREGMMWCREERLSVQRVMAVNE